MSGCTKNLLCSGERFDPSFCTKNKETGKRYWFACIVCPCTLYRDENLVHHVKGQRHQKRAIEKINSENNINRNKRKRGTMEGETIYEYDPVPTTSRSSRSDLQYRLINGAPFPFLGLSFITEYVNPGNPVSSKKIKYSQGFFSWSLKFPCFVLSFGCFWSKFEIQKTVDPKFLNDLFWNDVLINLRMIWNFKHGWEKLFM